MLMICEYRFLFFEKVDDWNCFNVKFGGIFVEKCCYFFDLMCLIFRVELICVFVLGGIDVNYLDEIYDGEILDILDNGYVIVDFDNGVWVMLELCMFVEGVEYQEEVSVVGFNVKIEVFVFGLGCFWLEYFGELFVLQVIVSFCNFKGLEKCDIFVDLIILEVGDYNGLIFY